MKILSSFTHPLMFLSSAEHKRYSEECQDVNNQTVDGPRWLPYYGKNTMEVNGSSTIWIPIFFFKWWQNFFFSVSYPFKPHIPAYPYSRKEKNKVTFSTSQFAFLNRAILNLA